jgi:hypothetical protein
VSTEPIRIHLTSGQTIVTCVADPTVEDDEILAQIQAQLSGDLEWTVIGAALVFPSRVAAVELL